MEEREERRREQKSTNTRCVDCTVLMMNLSDKKDNRVVDSLNIFSFSCKRDKLPMSEQRHNEASRKASKLH